MYRLTRNLAIVTAATALSLTAIAPLASAAERDATPSVATVHAKPKPGAEAADKGGKDKPKPGKGGEKGKKVKDAKKLVGERNAVIQIVRARDAQLVKVTKYVARETPATVADVAAKDALLANLAADRDTLAAIVATVAKTSTVAQVKDLKANVQDYDAENYSEASDLLYYAADNIEAAAEDPTAAGAAEAVEKAKQAVAVLVQVHATDAEALLDEAEALLDASDDLLYGADTDTDDTDEFDGEFDDETNFADSMRA